MEPQTPFEKPYIKVGEVQARIAYFLSLDPTMSNLDMADQSYDWFMELDRHKQVEILTYAFSRIRETAKRKTEPKDEAEARGKAAARKFVLQQKAKWLCSLTFEQLEAVGKVGPELMVKMRPGQKVKDVWNEAQVVKLLRSH